MKHSEIEKAPYDESHGAFDTYGVESWLDSKRCRPCLSYQFSLRRLWC